MIRSYISLSTGSKFTKYVRDSVVNGIDGEIYLYGDSIGDTIGAQTGAGKILGDYLSLLSSIEDTTEDFILFPESDGDTYNITRRNPNQALGVDDSHIDNVGDSRIFPVYMLSLKRNGIRTISIVEERVSPFFKKGFNSNTPKYVRDDYPKLPEEPSPIRIYNLYTLKSNYGDSISKLLPEAKGGVAPYSYSITNLPNGLTASSRNITGTINDAGTHIINYKITDNAGTKTTKKFYWNVQADSPGPPTNFSATQNSDGNIDLIWNTPTNTGGEITKYRIDQSINSDNNFMRLLLLPENVNSYTIENPIIGDTYFFRAYAENNGGRSTTYASANITAGMDRSFSAHPTIDKTNDYKDLISLVLEEPLHGEEPYNYVFTGLPAGLSFTESTRTISGTVNQIGEFTVIYTVSDNLGDSSGDTFIWNINATEPDEPTDFSITKGTGDLLELVWSEPNNNGGDSDLSYRIDKSSDGSTFTVLVTSTGDTSYGDSDVSLSGNTYYYRIFSINDAGTSTDYAEDSLGFAELALPTVDDKTNDFNDTLNLQLPAATGGSTPYSYSISGIPTGLSFNSSTRRITGNVTPVGDYTVTYSVSDDLGDTVSRTFNWEVELASPSAPRNVTGAEITSSSIKLTWLQPSNLGGDTVDNITYRINWRIGSPFGAAQTLILSTGDTSYTHNNLNAGTQYSYAINSNNSSELGNNVVWVGPIRTSIERSTEPTNFVVTADGGDALDLTWNAPSDDGGDSYVNYRIYSASDGVSFTTLVNSQTGTSYLHDNLTGGTTVSYRIYALNGAGTSSSYATGNGTTDLTVPSSPRDFATNDIGDTGVLLTWNEPSDDGGDSITYKLDFSINGGTDYTELANNIGDTYYEHIGLSSGDTIYYHLYAVNSIGQSTANSTHLVIGQSINIPSSPRNFSLTVLGDTSIYLVWDAPLNNGGDSSITYHIRVSTDNSTFTTLVSSQGDTYYTHDGLSSGSTRYYRINSENSAGESGDYASGNATTLSSPSAPRNFTVISAGDTSLYLTWGTPTNNGGDTNINYRIDVSNNGDTFTTLVTSQGDTSYTHNSVEQSIYYYRIYAINSIGTSTTYAENNAHITITQTIQGDLLLDPTAENITWRSPGVTNTAINPALVQDHEIAYIHQYRFRRTADLSILRIGVTPERIAPDIVDQDFSEEFEVSGRITFTVGATHTFILDLSSSEVTNDTTEDYSWDLTGTTLTNGSSFYDDVLLDSVNRTPVELTLELDGTS